MNPAPKDRDTSDDAAAIRAAIRNDMLGANTAVAVILGALLILVLVAGLAGIRATRNLHRAEEAEATGRERLTGAYFAQARAIRIAAEPGRRQLALNAITNAAAISKSTELRTEAVACLALTDLEQEGSLHPTPRDISHLVMNARLKYLGWADDQGNVTVSALQGNETFVLATKQKVIGLSFSPDGHWLAVKQSGDLISIWDLQSRQVLAGPPLQAEVGMSFSPDSQQLIFSDATADKLITLCHLPDFRLSRSAVKAGSQMFRTSDDLRKIAICNGTEVDVFDFPSGTNEVVLPHGSRVLLLAWSAGGHRLAVACDDGDIYLWDMIGGGHKILTGHSALCVSIGFSANGRLLFSSSRDGTTRLWDTALGKTIAIGEGIGEEISPDGGHIGFWRPWSGFGLWRVSPGAFYSILPCDPNAGPLFTVDLSKTGRWCVGTQNSGFRVWDLQPPEGRVTRAPNAARVPNEYYYPMLGIYCVRVSPDEQSLLLCRETGLESWPLELASDGSVVFRPDHARKIPLPEDRGARALAISQDSRTAAVELTDRRFIVLDLAGQRPPVVFRDQWRYTSFKGPGAATGAGRFAISPDGKWVATGFGFGADDVPKVWDASSGNLVATLKADTSVVGFSPDGRWLGLAGMNDSSLWSSGDWSERARFNRREPAITLGALAFGPDPLSEAITPTRQMIRLKNFEEKTSLVDLISPEPQSINAVRLSLDGTTLVAATANNLVEVWRLDRLQEQLTAMGLDWKPSANELPVAGVNHVNPENETVTFVATLVGFVLAAGFSLVALWRHRMAIERFARAEARSAQRNRQLNAAKIELIHSQKMQALGTLATGIAHDFNNLLSVIRMSNKLIGRRAGQDPEIHDLVGEIEQAVLQGKGVVGSMLGYAGNRDGAAGPVDVAAVVEDVVALLSKEFLRGITLDLQLERDITRVNMGRGAIEQILLNLVVNASEAMQGSGRLKISAREAVPSPQRAYVLRPAIGKWHVELTVADSGSGIAPELLDRVFEPFFTTKHGGPKSGTGLGLSLVYSLAEQGGAGLQVKTGHGVGTEFTLYIPVESGDPVRETHSAKSMEVS